MIPISSFFFLKKTTQQLHVSNWKRKSNLHFFDGFMSRLKSFAHLRWHPQKKLKSDSKRIRNVAIPLITDIYSS